MPDLVSGIISLGHHVIYTIGLSDWGCQVECQEDMPGFENMGELKD